jgi:hypothetical protein
VAILWVPERRMNEMRVALEYVGYLVERIAAVVADHRVPFVIVTK